MEFQIMFMLIFINELAITFRHTAYNRGNALIKLHRPKERKISITKAFAINHNDYQKIVNKIIN